MDLREFVKNVLVDINAGVDAARESTSRDISIAEKDNARTVEFDIAVSAETTNNATGGGGIKVLKVLEAGANASRESKDSTVSRIIFGLRINPSTKTEQAASREAATQRRVSSQTYFPPTEGRRY